MNDRCSVEFETLWRETIYPELADSNFLYKDIELIKDMLEVVYEQGWKEGIRIKKEAKRKEKDV